MDNVPLTSEVGDGPIHGYKGDRGKRICIFILAFVVVAIFLEGIIVGVVFAIIKKQHEHFVLVGVLIITFLVLLFVSNWYRFDDQGRVKFLVGCMITLVILTSVALNIYVFINKSCSCSCGSDSCSTGFYYQSNCLDLGQVCLLCTGGTSAAATTTTTADAATSASISSTSGPSRLFWT